MGDRSNVFIQQGVHGNRAYGVGVYSHWGGRGFQDQAITMIDKARARIGDPAYFTRILVQNLLNAAFDADSETGGGIWAGEYGMPDNEHPILVINADTGKYAFISDRSYLVPLVDVEQTI
jgi:hypothetical protein